MMTHWLDIGDTFTDGFDLGYGVSRCIKPWKAEATNNPATFVSKNGRKDPLWVFSTACVLVPECTLH